MTLVEELWPWLYSIDWVCLAFIRVTGVEFPGESSVYKYAPEYVTTHLPGESSENRIRLLEEYSILYIQVSLTTECPKG